MFAAIDVGSFALELGGFMKSQTKGSRVLIMSVI